MGGFFGGAKNDWAANIQAVQAANQAQTLQQTIAAMAPPPPPPPPPPPKPAELQKPKPPAAMPDAENPMSRELLRRQYATLGSSSGRASTILSR